LFSIPILLLITSGELYIRSIPTEFGNQKEDLLSKADSIEILITGSSHARRGLIQDQFNLYTYDIAFGSQTIYFDRRIIEKYLGQLTQLKYVIISLEYTSLYTEHEENRDFFYHYYYGINYRNRTFYKEYFLQSFFVYDPRLTVHLIAENLLSSQQEKQENEPWFASPGYDYETQVLSVAKCETRGNVFNRIIKDWKGGDAILNDLESFIVLLQSKNITPILLNFPCSPLLRSFQDEKIVRKNNQVANYLSYKYNIMYLDYWDDDRFVYTDYYDPDHLNMFGAEKLTKQVNAIIMKMEMQKSD
jgi:hypothetical protein